MSWLNLPASFTFFTTLTWTANPSLPELDPGNGDYWMVVESEDVLEETKDQAPASSLSAGDLEARRGYVEASGDAIIKGYGPESANSRRVRTAGISGTLSDPRLSLAIHRVQNPGRQVVAKPSLQATLAGNASKLHPYFSTTVPRTYFTLR